ncbi:MAG: DUF3307 domain-containing protein [Paracoccaceae bacterium]
MTETFAALLLAHALTEFLFRNKWMSDHRTHPGAIAMHGAISCSTGAIALGQAHPLLLALGVVHLAIDHGCRLLLPRRFGGFALDQALHLLSLLTLAACWPGLFAEGVWAQAPALAPLMPGLMTIAAGLVLSVQGGAVAIAMLLAPWQEEAPQGLPGGGRAIGSLERGLIFLLVLAGQAEAIGLLIAAKSVLRFGAVKDDLKVSEYVIIGTLASFAWAIAVAVITLFLLSGLPPLGIPDLTP